MKLRVSSDWHLEFYRDFSLHDIINHIEEFILPKLEDDKNTVLCLAGDIGKLWHYGHIIPYLQSRFKDVIYTHGNHEYYGKSAEIIGLDSCSPITVIDGVQFIACPLFSDINWSGKQNFIVGSLNDFRLIDGLTVSKYTELFDLYCNYIIDSIDQSKNTVVVTHHAPSFKSVNKKYASSMINDAFASNLDDIVACVDTWVHGHMHDSVSYRNVVCNPYGYHGENKEYNPTLVLEI